MPKQKSFPLAPQIQHSFYQQTYYLIAAGKQQGAGSAGFQVQYGQPQLEWPQEAVMQVVTDSLPAQQAQSSRSSFTQHRPLGDWVTWTCVHSEEHFLFNSLANLMQYSTISSGNPWWSEVGG